MLERKLSEASSGVAVMRSELNAVSSQFIGAGRSTKALTAENDVLQRTIYSLDDQLRAQNELLNAATAMYGSASESTQKYQQAVNNTTAEINKANARIESNTAQINLNAKQSTGLNAILDKVGLNVGDVAQKFGVSTDAASKLTAALGSSAAGFATVAIAAAKAIGAMNDFAKEQAQHIDQINTLARNYHMTAKQMQEFDYMSALIDVDTQSVTGAISRLTRTMADAKDGTGEAAAGFVRLGVDVVNADGSLRDSTAVFYDTIDALGRIRSETEQDALAMQIFGRSAMDLRGVIDEGSTGLQAYAEEANRLGVVLSDEANKRLQSLQDEADRTEAVQNALKQNWAAVWAPAAEFFEGVKGGFASVANTAVEAFIQSGEAIDQHTDNIKQGLANAGVESDSFLMKIADLGGGAAKIFPITRAVESVAAAFSNARDEAEKLNNTLAINTLNGPQILAGSIRDLNKNDPLDMLPTKQAEYIKYLRQANEVQAELGYKIGIASYENWSSAYDKAHSQAPSFNFSVQLDGREIAHTEYQYRQYESALRGRAIP